MKPIGTNIFKYSYVFFFFMICSYAQKKIIPDSILYLSQKVKDKDLSFENRLEYNHQIYSYIKQNVKNDSLKNTTLKNYVYLYYKLNDTINFPQYANEHLKHTTFIQDSINHAKTLEYFAAHYRKQHDIDSTFSYYYKSFTFYNKLNDSLSAGKMLLNMAILQKNVHDYKGAEKSSFKALDYLRSTSNKRRISSVYNNLAIVYNNLKEYELAIKYHQKALNIRQEIHENSIYVLQSLNNIGKSYKDSKDYKNAIDAFETALEQDSTLNTHLETKAALIDNLAHARFRLGKTKHTHDQFIKALQIREDINNPHGVIISSLHLAEYYIKLKNYDIARQYALKAEKIAKETKKYRDYIEALELMSDLSVGDELKDTFKKYAAIRDSLYLVDKRQEKSFVLIQTKINQLEQNIKSNQLTIGHQKEEIAYQKLKFYILFSFIGLILFISTRIILKKRRITKELDSKVMQLEQEYIQVKTDLIDKKQLEEEQLKQVKESGSFEKYIRHKFGLEAKGYHLLKLMYEQKTQIEQASELGINENTLKWFKRVKFYPQLNIGWKIVHKQQEAARIYKEELDNYNRHN